LRKNMFDGVFVDGYQFLSIVIFKPTQPVAATPEVV
jgi:hypothetical protein